MLAHYQNITAIRWLKLAMVLSSLLIFAGCTGVVRTQINAFKAEQESLTPATIAVEAGDEVANSSLEFAHYRGRVENKLADQGFTIVRPDQGPEYIAKLSFGVQETEPTRTSSTSYVTQPYGSYFRPNLGVVVTRDSGRREYLRRVNLQVARQQYGEILPVYEVTGRSYGRCPIISVVFDEMLEALFTDFPAEAGTVRNVSVRGDTRC